MNAATKAIHRDRLAAMSTPDLLARQTAVLENLKKLRHNRMICPYYYSIEAVRTERAQNYYELRNIGKILKRRAAHVAANEAALERNEVGAALAEV